MSKFKKRARMTGFIFGGILLIILFFTSTTVVEPGYKGVVFSLNGGLKPEVLDQGLNFHLPYPISSCHPISRHDRNCLSHKIR